MKSAKTNQKTIVDRLRPDRTRNKYFKGVERKETILHSTDAIGWRPMEYYIPDRFQQFLSNLDSDIDTLISKAGPDRYNPGYYEKIISSEIELAIKEIEQQQVEHTKDIHLIRIYQNADLETVESDIERLEQALNAMEG